MDKRKELLVNIFMLAMNREVTAGEVEAIGLKLIKDYEDTCINCLGFSQRSPNVCVNCAKDIII